VRQSKKRLKKQARFIKFDDHRAAGIALAMGFVHCAAVVALRGASERGSGNLCAMPAQAQVLRRAIIG
jgi:hypothetical protein